jgi:hypothetical protein
MAGILGPLIQVATQGMAGGLRGQNAGDQQALENRAQQQRLQLAEEESRQRAEEMRQRAGLVQAQIDELNRRRQEYVPTTEEESIDYQLRSHPERLQKPDSDAQLRNIDPLSPEGIAARLEYERNRPRPTSFDREYGAPGTAGGPSLADEFKLVGAIGAEQDDVDRRIARRERDMVPKWHDIGLAGQALHPDSASWDQGRARDSTAIDGLQKRYDQLGETRSGLVNRLLQGGAKGEGGKSEENATPHNGKEGLAAYQERLDELTQQLQEALAQVPEGDPSRAAMTKRFQELSAQAAREAGLTP